MRFLPVAVLIMAAVLSACKEDPCENVTCLNGGTCVDGLGTCECQPGFEGDSCEVFTFQLFLGSFEADYGGCVDTPPEHRVGIEQKDGEEKLLISNLGDYACPDGDLVIEGDVSGGTVTIPEQVVDCGEIMYTFQGNGSVAGAIVTINFTVTYDADGFDRTDQCTATLTKE